VSARTVSSVGHVGLNVRRLDRAVEFSPEAAGLHHLSFKVRPPSASTEFADHLAHLAAAVRKQLAASSSNVRSRRSQRIADEY
jgi:hypothetical protein